MHTSIFYIMLHIHIKKSKPHTVNLLKRNGNMTKLNITIKLDLVITKENIHKKCCTAKVERCSVI